MVNRVLEGHDENLLTSLIEEHKEIENQPLHLAIAYRLGDSASELYLLEVSENFGGNRVSDEKLFLKAWVAQPPDFRFHEATEFYLVLTNLAEFSTAISETWSQISELKWSIEKGLAKKLFSDEQGEKLWAQLGGR